VLAILGCGFEESEESYKPNHLHTPPVKLPLHLRKGAQLCRAYWRVVRRVREEDRPAVADEFVEVDVSRRCCRLEIRSYMDIPSAILYMEASGILCVPVDPIRNRGCSPRSEGVARKRRRRGADGRCRRILGRAMTRRGVFRTLGATRGRNEAMIGFWSLQMLFVNCNCSFVILRAQEKIAAMASEDRCCAQSDAPQPPMGSCRSNVQLSYLKTLSTRL